MVHDCIKSKYIVQVDFGLVYKQKSTNRTELCHIWQEVQVHCNLNSAMDFYLKPAFFTSSIPFFLTAFKVQVLNQLQRL